MIPYNSDFDLMALIALCLSLTPTDSMEDPLPVDPMEEMFLSLCDLDWKQASNLMYWASSSIAGEPVWIIFYHQPAVYEQNLFGTFTNKIIHPSKYILSFYSQDPLTNNYTNAYRCLIQSIESTNIDSRYTDAMSDVYNFITTAVASKFASKFIGS